MHSAVEDLRRSRIQPVINGTGVLIHTNLGRAPLGPAVIETLTSVGASYNNLEFDLGGGGRGGRAAYLEHSLALLCGAEGATVVNNCAAALVLILRHFAKAPRDQVVISRGELIQIGGLSHSGNSGSHRSAAPGSRDHEQNLALGLRQSNWP